MLCLFGEPEPGIDDDARTFDTGVGRRVDAHAELAAHFSHDIVVRGPRLHVRARPARVHDDVRASGRGNDLHHRGVSRATAHVVDNRRTGVESGLCNDRARRVDAHDNTGSRELTHDRDHPVGFDLWFDPLGARPGGLAADVDDVRAGCNELEGVRDRRGPVGVPPAIGEGVRCDIQDTDDERAFQRR